MMSAASIPKDLSYLYERFVSKLSDEGFHDTWSIGSFLVIFIFCMVTLTLMLAVVFSWCCGWCFQEPIHSGQVGVMVTATANSTNVYTSHLLTPPTTAPTQEMEEAVGPNPTTPPLQTLRAEHVPEVGLTAGRRSTKKKQRKIRAGEIRRKHQGLLPSRPKNSLV